MLSNWLLNFTITLPFVRMLVKLGQPNHLLGVGYKTDVINPICVTNVKWRNLSLHHSHTLWVTLARFLGQGFCVPC